MRIGIDIRAIGYQRTGDETYTLQLIKSLAKVDLTNQYFLYTDISDKKGLIRVKKLLSVKNKNFTIITVTPRSKLFWTMYSLPKRAKKDQLDVLHVQYITPLFLPKKIKLITTIHDISFARYPEFISRKDLLILKLFIKPSLKRADKIIAVSKFTREEIIKVYNIEKGKVVAIPNGGVADEFLQPIKDKKVLAFLNKCGIIKPYLLYLGTLQPRKRIPFLIKAFVDLKIKYSQTNKQIKNLELVIRGTKNGHNYDRKIDTVLDTIKKNNPEIYKQIKFIGYVSNEDIPLIFKGAIAFCFTSIYEGFGLPLLEAMAVQTPVVVNDNSCFPEIVGEAGIIYRTDDKNDLINKIRQIVEDKNIRQRIIKEGLNRVHFFTWEKNAQQTVQLYKKI